MKNNSKIRNFSIIAHIDHGKSTLADRMLEFTGTVEARNMKEQLLDQMDLERERGITIKLQPARMEHKGHTLNLIDTPGHVDFTYEVSRSLAACEAAVLLVDATQGVQAQTLGNLFMALDQNLEIIPVLNKIDLPAADVEGRSEELINLIGCKREDIIFVSAKTGEGVDELLDAVIAHTPPPKEDVDKPARAHVFDSKYDEFKGVVAYVRVFEGVLKRGDTMRLVATGIESEILAVGAFRPAYSPTEDLAAGQIGYVVTGHKDIEACQVGDTLTRKDDKAEPLPGYQPIKPFVYAGVFPKEGNEYEELREAVLKLKLSDAALSFEPEQSSVLGFGFRCGFLGMLHLEIFQERLSREFNIELVVTTPSVAYQVTKTSGQPYVIKSPQDLPDRSHIELIEEPWVKADIISPSDYIGAVMSLVQEKRGKYLNTEYLDKNRVILHYEIPLAMIIVDFYDKLKTVTSGYASLNYEILEYRPANVVKMDILVTEEPVEALASLVYEDEAHQAGKRVVKALKDSIPREQFVIKLQAAIGGKIVAAERISAFRKDVTAKLYGGDVTRKRKLLEKQKKGKKKMLSKAKVDIPMKAYMAVLKR